MKQDADRLESVMSVRPLRRYRHHSVSSEETANKMLVCPIGDENWRQEQRLEIPERLDGVKYGNSYSFRHIYFPVTEYGKVLFMHCLCQGVD